MSKVNNTRCSNPGDPLFTIECLRDDEGNFFCSVSVKVDGRSSAHRCTGTYTDSFEAVDEAKSIVLDELFKHYKAKYRRSVGVEPE